MSRQTTLILHRLGSLSSTMMIAAFWFATVSAELLARPEHIALVKITIAYCTPLVLLGFAVAAFTGNRLAGRSKAPSVRTKRRRSVVMAALGCGVLIPASFALAYLASSGEVDSVRFVVIQTTELVAGAANLVTAARQIRDGLRLTSRSKPASVRSG